MDEFEHDVPAGGYFNPKLYLQRYEFVKKIIEETNSKSVLDLGCGEGTFIKEVTKLNRVEKIVGIDINPTRLGNAKLAFNKDFDNNFNTKIRRKTDLEIELYRGSVTDECDPRVCGTDFVSCIELIEHINEEEHCYFTKTIFESLKPRYAVITTPNREFNQHWPNLRTYRHIDHRFEWTRCEFKDFVNAIIHKYPDYKVRIDGIGRHWGGDHSQGYCSQAAIFERKSRLPPQQPPIYNVLSHTFDLKHKIKYSKYDFKLKLYQAVTKACLEDRNGNDDCTTITMSPISHNCGTKMAPNSPIITAVRSPLISPDICQRPIRSPERRSICPSEPNLPPNIVSYRVNDFKDTSSTWLPIPPLLQFPVIAALPTRRNAVNKSH